MTLLDAGLRRLGIEGLGEVSWGTHFCLFYTTEGDLLDLLVPYFKTGLEDHEFCLWVAETPKEVEHARQAMRESVPNFEQYVTEGQIEFVTYAGWYLSNGNFDSQKVIQRWIDRLQQALDKGYAGMRARGNTFWLERHHWRSFAEYEAELESTLHNLRMIVLCVYALERCTPDDVLDVIGQHQITLARRKGAWEHLEGSELKRAHGEILKLNVELEQRVMERTAELKAINDQLNQVVAEHKRAEERLREYEKVVEGLEEMIVVVDREYRYVIANRAFLDYRGMQREQVVGHFVPEVLGEETFENIVKEKLEECFQGNVVEYEMNHTYPKLGERDLFLSYFPIEGPAGIDRAACILRDITEQKHAEAERERLFEELRQSHQQLKILSRRLVEAEETERKRLAREIHDDISQSLTALTMQLGSVRNLLPKSARAARSLLEETEALTQSTLERTRSMIAGLRPSILDELGLSPALHRLANELHESTGAIVMLKTEGLPKRLPPQLEIALFRIVQEALTNIRKHAQASEVTIQLVKEARSVILSVQDNGVGIENQEAGSSQSANAVLAAGWKIPAGHFGLIGIQERVKSLGGNFQLTSAPTQGTTIRVELPL